MRADAASDVARDERWRLAGSDLDTTTRGLDEPSRTSTWLAGSDHGGDGVHDDDVDVDDVADRSTVVRTVAEAALHGVQRTGDLLIVR